MTKTTVRRHSRKGTKGVKKHSREVKKGTVPPRKSVKKRLTAKQMARELGLDSDSFSFYSAKKKEWTNLDDFNDIPESDRKKEWNFDVTMDRIPVEGSTEFGFVEINGLSHAGKEKQAVNMGIDLSKGKLVPHNFKTFHVYDEISFDSRFDTPVEETDTEARKKIERVTRSTIRSNFPNHRNTIKMIWRKY